jgi:transposase
VPGVKVIVAASFLAAIGDIGRFREPAQARRLPRARSAGAPVGARPASHGHISEQGSVRARHALVEACWTAVRQPGPLHAFYERVRARRGHSVWALRSRWSSATLRGAMRAVRAKCSGSPVPGRTTVSG